MITLSLDEYGDFESVKGVNDAIFIGGVLYDDKGSSKDKKQESLRIRAYYEKVIGEVSQKLGQELKYPHALHAGTGYDSTVEYEVKTLVAKTIGEFLQKGTYQGEPISIFNGNQWKKIDDRAGNYAIYCIVKSDEGKIERNAEQAGFLLRDNYASNLYHHMASDTIKRTIFQNPLADEQSHFFLQIATRASGSIARGSALSKQYRKQHFVGVKKDRDGNDIVLKDGTLAEYFQLTNPDIYRTIIEQFVSEDNPRKSIIDDFKVESIIYKNPDLGQEFLFLADSVCAIFSFELNKRGRDNAESWLNEINARALELLPKEKLLIFGYDSADVDFGKALEAYQRGDFYTALNIVCDAETKKKGFYKFYKDTWYQYILDEIQKSDNVPAFISAVRNVYNSQLSNEYIRKNGLFVLDELEKKVHQMKALIRTPERQSIFYKLYEALMIAYCHEGNSKEAEAYYKKARAYAHRVSTEEYLRTRNFMAVFYCDCFEMEKALKIADENIGFAHKMAVLKEEIDDQISMDGYLSESKAYSQRGQVLAFMKDGKAENDFRKALSMMALKSADYYITESYLLHHYIDMGNREKYESYAADYFGTRDLFGQLEFIFKEGLETDPIINFMFAMYVYVKALFTFYKDKLSDDMWSILTDWKGYAEQLGLPFERVERMSGAHPGELIYKYILLFAVDRKDTESVTGYEVALDKVQEKSPLLKAIKIIGKIEMALAQEKQLFAYDDMTDLCKLLEDNYPCFSEIDYTLTTVQLLDYLKTKFTFMYV